MAFLMKIHLRLLATWKITSALIVAIGGIKWPSLPEPASRLVIIEGVGQGVVRVES